MIRQMIFGILSSPRATVVNFGRSQGDDMAELIIRAGSKPGAILTARREAMSMIPLREQEVVYTEQMDSDRFLNKWRVKVVDKQSTANIVEQ